MTIKVSVKPRQDNLFDIWVGDEGDHFVNSNQGYENVEDAVAIAHRLFGAGGSEVDSPLHHRAEPVELVVEYRDGTTKTERLR